MDDDEVPLPSTEQEVSENVYDWSDPERNDYDSDDSFLAKEDDDDLVDDDAACDDDDEVAVLSPRTLAEMDRRGRPRRSTRPPARYSPPVDDSEGDERYSYECLGADDDGQSESEIPLDDDDESVYNPNNGGDSSEEEAEADDGEDSGEDDEELPSSPRGVKRKTQEVGESPELVLEHVADQHHRHNKPENPSTDG